MSDESPELLALRRRLEEEESAYADLLKRVDELAAFPLPAEGFPELPALMGSLNALWEAVPPPEGGGLLGRPRRRLYDAMAPALRRQQDFDSAVVKVLNGHLDRTAALHARLRDLVSVLVQYLQRVLPVMDARDRVSSALATTRAELILEAFDRRQESLARRVDGLRAMADRLEALAQEVAALRDALAAGAPAPAVARAAEAAAADSAYVAFENRFRGSREEIRGRLAGYAEMFVGLAPVLDLGCGRGEFLDQLRERGIPARGAEANAAAARSCRERGLDVAEADLIAFLESQPQASAGGVFAAQVAEHLPPATLQAMLRQAHRVLRRGGLMVLETVNPRSVVGFLEVYIRDLTHERPLHPDTLSFLAAAAGFTDVRVETRSPVEPAARLQPVPAGGLPERAVQALNENVERLNQLLYGPQEYALLARR